MTARVQTVNDGVSAAFWTRRHLVLDRMGRPDVKVGRRSPSPEVTAAIDEALRLNAEDLRWAMVERDAAHLETFGRPCTGCGYSSFEELVAWSPA